ELRIMIRKWKGELLLPSLNGLLLFLVLAVTLCPQPAVAQWLPLNHVSEVQLQPNGALFTLQSGYLRLQVDSDSIVHVVYSLEKEVPTRQDFLIKKTSWPKTSFSLHTEDAKVVSLSTSQLKIEVNRSDSAITFYDALGHKLAQENSRTLTPIEVNGEKTYHAERFVNMWDTQEAFYGLGQHQAGVWNYRGEAVELSQDNTNISIPMLLSSNGYGIFWNNGSRSRMNNRFVHALYLTSEVADAVDYYFLYGPEFDKIVASYRELTGAAPLFGKWAYGYWQCKNRYDSQQTLLDIARKYRDLHIPLDNIVQDWFWWNTMGEPVFNKNY